VHLSAGLALALGRMDQAVNLGAELAPALTEVLAEHSTDVQGRKSERKGGEVTPKRPTAGKVKPGITFLW